MEATLKLQQERQALHCKEVITSRGDLPEREKTLACLNFSKDKKENFYVNGVG